MASLTVYGSIGMHWQAQLIEQKALHHEWVHQAYADGVYWKALGKQANQIRMQQPHLERGAVVLQPHAMLTREMHAPIVDVGALHSKLEDYQPLIDYSHKALQAWQLWDRILKHSEVGHYALHPDYGKFTHCREKRNTLAQQLWDQRMYYDDVAKDIPYRIPWERIERHAMQGVVAQEKVQSLEVSHQKSTMDSFAKRDFIPSEMIV